jgi:hypothetical protein
MAIKEKIKDHIREHPMVYSVGLGTIVATITVIVMRGVKSQPIDRGISVIAKRGISVLGKKVVLHNVSYISSDRQGPPSWVIRCKETGEIFTSQLAAAKEMGLSSSEISKHLNGKMDHVRGNTFERICMAA